MPAKKKVVVKKQVKFMGATGKVPIKASKSVATKPVPKRRKPRSRAVSTVAYLGNGRIWSFPASKGPPHIMVLPDSGLAICSCTFKRRRGTCSHEEAMNMMGMADKTRPKPITGISINTINTPDLDWHVAE